MTTTPTQPAAAGSPLSGALALVAESIAARWEQYRALLFRYATPEEGDPALLAAVMHELSLTPERVKSDLAAIQEIEAQRGLLCRDRIHAAGRAAIEAEPGLEQEKARLQRRTAEIDREINDLRGAAPTLAQQHWRAEERLREWRGSHPYLFEPEDANGQGDPTHPRVRGDWPADRASGTLG